MSTRVVIQSIFNDWNKSSSPQRNKLEQLGTMNRHEDESFFCGVKGRGKQENESQVHLLCIEFVRLSKK